MARPPLRSLAPWIVLAALGPLALASLGLLGFAFTDYEAEAAPAFAALVHGDFTRFLELCPAYGGSLIMRAPFALAADALGGGEVAVFRAVAAPCLLAGAALGVVLAASLLARGAGRGTVAIVVGLCAVNPITLRALDIGHPEELLGAVLCAGAVLAAVRGRSTLSGILLGLAVANKAWAVLAVGPVLLALEADRRRALAIAGAIAAAFVLPLLLTGAESGQPGAAAQTGSIFQPWQVWWFLGSTGEVIRGADGVVKEGYRAAPGWVSPLSHPLIVGLALPLSLLAWRRRSDPLLLLALLFVLRCVLDPWNTAYYALPAIITLVVWEATRTERPPVYALALTMATWATWEWVVPAASADVEALVYLGWSLPLVGLLGWRLYAPVLPAMPALSTGGRASVWSTTQ
ncbi:MAG TPA: hypothetical protein VEX67_03430 [Solirubrobacteraceae bacterium]|nr:hypothetical protein [Solirubrobacteraceae bacterium]